MGLEYALLGDESGGNYSRINVLSVVGIQDARVDDDVRGCTFICISVLQSKLWY